MTISQNLRRISQWKTRDNRKYPVSCRRGISTNASSCGILKQYVTAKGGVFTGEQDIKEVKEHICAGLLAHVDAGKTTLSEGLLYSGGKIKEKGRVDNQDAYLDTFALERARGITIFSKQAVFRRGEREYTLLDTPGHVDFSPEMERTMQVLDYAILVISAADGVQGHTRTLWRLLNRYQIPVFLFVNKMDQPGADRDRVLGELKKRLDEN